MKRGKVPVNGLDRALVAVLRSKAELPRLVRALCEGELWFVIPYKEGMKDGSVPLDKDTQVTFKRYSDAEGKFIPIFSSRERLEEFLSKGKTGPGNHGVVAMPAKALLAMLGHADSRTVLNMACSTGGLEIPGNLMRDIADGSVMKPKPPVAKHSFQLVGIRPEDYPTELVQAAFEYMRSRPAFRAAWVFNRVTPEGETMARFFQLVIHLEPDDPTLREELKLTLSAAYAKDESVHAVFRDPADKAFLATLWKEFVPFYVAKDVGPPEP